MDAIQCCPHTFRAVRAQGSYAEAKAKFLSPDQSKISELVNALREKQIGIVAHFYMDPEVQGILTAAKRQWPHIHISDSLVMADSAVQMAEAGCKYIAVLGVDFMSENVRAILDQAGFTQAFAEIPDLNVWYGPDSYMGANIADLFKRMTIMSDEEITEIHPDHNRKTISSLLQRLHYYQCAQQQPADAQQPFPVSPKGSTTWIREPATQPHA
uniref:quinolinate synthase n=1 Tax=Aegilops tauschii TaxID=37682 RepID=M8BCR8_AEGTA